MTEAIARHETDLVHNYLSRYKIPEVLRVIRGEMSLLSLLLWVWNDVQERCRRYQEDPDLEYELPNTIQALLWVCCSPVLQQ